MAEGPERAAKNPKNPNPVRHLSSKEKSLTEAHLNFVGSQVAASRWLWWPSQEGKT